ncbi:MAG: LCP family protein [Ruthenibacterium sp.]
MSKTKAFWLSLGGTLAILIPLYLMAMAWTLTRVQPTDKPQQGVPIAQPTRADAKTVLILTGAKTAQTADTYVLVSFDALKNKVAVAALPQQTVVQIDGTQTTLREAAERAGPSQCVAALMETLNIPIDNYLFGTPETLCKIAEPLGNIKLPLGDYLTEEALGQLRLSVPGVQTHTLSPRLFVEILASGQLGDAPCNTLREDGYLAFLQADTALLAQVLPDAVRKNSAALATNITATQIYDYARIFDFFAKEQPQYSALAMPGHFTHEHYLLDADATKIATEALRKTTPEYKNSAA